MNKKIFYIALLGILIGGLIGWIAGYFFSKDPESYRGTILRQKDKLYEFIDPLFACDVGSEKVFTEFKPLKYDLQSLINQKVKRNEIKEASVYIRSFKSGRWLEINDELKFTPASLMKVFVMMSYYKEAEDANDPDLLNRKMTVKKSPYSNQKNILENSSNLLIGNSYTADEIIDQMIIYSDNNALHTLTENFTIEALNDLDSIFSELNIPYPDKDFKIDFMTTTNYAMVFRVLYGATYLNRSHSEKALELLSKSFYQKGISAGVPSNLVVAHKFGVYDDATAPKDELHDCGIIYYPDHPYLICVMTRGSDFIKLQDFIQEISNTTYKFLNDFYSKPQNQTGK